MAKIPVPKVTTRKVVGVKKASTVKAAPKFSIMKAKTVKSAKPGKPMKSAKKAPSAPKQGKKFKPTQFNKTKKSVFGM